MHGSTKASRVGAVLLAALAAAATGCGPSADGVGLGTVTIAVTSADVAAVSVAISGPGIPTAIEADLSRSGDQWTGTLVDVPAGPARTVMAEGRDASGTVVYQGAATGVTVEEGAAASVIIVMQEVHPPPPYTNVAPVIDSVFTSDDAPRPGDAVSLSVTAHDVDAGAVLAYAWTATAGTFDPAAANVPDVVWIAPESGGEQTITVRVTDEKGLSTSVSFTIGAAAPAGSLDVGVTVNSWPVVTAMTATPSRADVGEPVALTVTASDSDADALAIAWSSDCAGTFDPATGASSSFTPSGVPAGNLCTIRVDVADGRSGTATGSTGIWIGLPGPTHVTLPPSGELGLVEGQVATAIENSVRDEGGGLGTVRVSLPGPSTPGNLILVVVSQNTRSSPVAISDNLGNTTAAGRYLTNALATARMGTTYSVEAFWLPSCGAGVQHIDVRSGAFQHLMIVAAEFSGVARVADPFDQGFTRDVFASGDGTVFSAGTTPPTSASRELVVAVARSVPTPGLTYAAGSGFTLVAPTLVAEDDDAFAVEYGVSTSAGPQAATFVQQLATGSSSHHAFVITFRGA